MKLGQEIIQKLKDYFAARENVSMAFVFGSQAKETMHRESDLDIAVYFKLAGPALEWEENQEYHTEAEIEEVVGKISGNNVDLVVLNRAPALLATEILDTGVPLIVKDRALYWRFYLMVSDAAQDYLVIANDWRLIRERSQSLSEPDRVRLLRLIDFIETNLAELPRFQAVDQQTYERVPDTRRNLERWTETLATTLIDLAKIILASEKKITLQQSYVELTKQLGFAAKLEPAETELLSEFSKLRNLLAHEYLDLRYAKIRRFLDRADVLYPKILTFTKNYLGLAL